MIELTKLIVPVLVSSILSACLTFIFNIFFYRFVKDKIDKSIERHKIAYSGVFKEKVDIYKDLLKKTYQLKRSIRIYSRPGEPEKKGYLLKLVDSKIDAYEEFYLINQPFLSSDLINNIQDLVLEFKSCIDAFYMRDYIKGEPSLHDNEAHKEDRKRISSEALAALAKLQKKGLFEVIENKIMDEMRKDLQTDTL